jgi:hypothetical protein
MEHAAGVFGAQQNETDLWAVPVSDDDVPALGDHLNDMHGSLSYGCELVGNALMRLVFDERIAPYGDNG